MPWARSDLDPLSRPVQGLVGPDPAGMLREHQHPRGEQPRQPLGAKMGVLVCLMAVCFLASAWSGSWKRGSLPFWGSVTPGWQQPRPPRSFVTRRGDPRGARPEESRDLQPVQTRGASLSPSKAGLNPRKVSPSHHNRIIVTLGTRESR